MIGAKAMSREFRAYLLVILGLFVALFFWLLTWPIATGQKSTPLFGDPA